MEGDKYCQLSCCVSLEAEAQVMQRQSELRSQPAPAPVPVGTPPDLKARESLVALVQLAKALTLV